MTDNLTTLSVTHLPLITCYYIDLPNNGIDCSKINQTECVKCEFRGKYFTNETIDDTSSMAHVICLIIWAFTLLIGSFATWSNMIIILVLKSQNSGRAFDILLTALATWDMICSVLAMVGSTFTVVFFQNWDRGPTTLYLIYFGTFLYVTRSGSAFMTVAITIERFLVVTYPIKFGRWFSRKKTRIIVFLVLIWSVLLAIPFYSVKIVPNKVGKNIKSISGLEFIIMGTSLHDFCYTVMGAFTEILDFWVPLPVLLIFNGLIYYQIKKFYARRKELNQSHQKDIRMAKMFFPVVFVLFLCNILPILNIYFIVNGILSREIGFGAALSFTVNSAVNLPIYYFGDSSFGKETRKLFAGYFSFIKKEKEDIIASANNSTNNSNNGNQGGETSESSAG